jgi:putative phage-type endonuclease
MIIHDVQQGTPEWLACRCGKFTASTFGDLFMGKTTKGYQEAINKVVFERITGEVPESYQNDFMKRGTELEPLAREAYELQTFNFVQQVGFIEYDENIGGSPDGLIGEQGMLEIKCPKWNTLIGYILEDVIPKDYMFQMQGNLFVSGRQWCDFYVWHPKFTPMLRRVNRDEKMIAEIQKKLSEAIGEVQERIKRIKG